MILTPDELAEYAPGAASCETTAISPEAAIAMAEALAMGYRGSNRPLGLTQHVENLMVGRSMASSLKHWPIVINDTHPVQIRIRSIDPALIQVTDWTTLPSDQYELTDRGRIILAIAAPGFLTFGRHTRGLRPLRRDPKTELEVTYWAGFDFESDSEPVRQMKAALGGIVSLQSAATKALHGIDGSGDDISEVTVDDEYSIKRVSAEKKATAAAQLIGMSGSVSPLEAYLSVFRGYRARLSPT